MPRLGLRAPPSKVLKDLFVFPHRSLLISSSGHMHSHVCGRIRILVGHLRSNYHRQRWFRRCGRRSGSPERFAPWFPFLSSIVPIPEAGRSGGPLFVEQFVHGQAPFVALVYPKCFSGRMTKIGLPQSDRKWCPKPSWRKGLQQSIRSSSKRSPSFSCSIGGRHRSSQLGQ